MTAAWHNSRPRLTIEHVGGSAPFPCVTKTLWRITSSPLRVSRQQIDLLAQAGQLGCGQEYRVLSQCDGKEAPSSHDSVSCKELDARGNVVRDPAVNALTGEPYPNHDIPVFTYDVERTCDSGD